jgi:predicted metal-binding membrane protein
MSGAALENILRRERVIVATSLAVLTLLAWVYILWLINGMQMQPTDAGTMTMPDMDMSGGMSDGSARTMLEPALRAWSGSEFIFTLAMWVVMMIGMMMPSAAPMILLYARVGRQSAIEGKPLAATGFFAGGYLLAWAGFSLAATTAQWALERALLITPMMASTSTVFTGFVLISAGLFQWTRVKNACLTHCQNPIAFIQHHGGFRRDPLGSLTIGFRHGVYCVGCCWALMGLLFVGGVMNPLWIAGIAIYVLAEKLLPAMRLLPRIAGAVLITAGMWLLLAFAMNL